MFANLPIYAVEVIVIANMRGSTATTNIAMLLSRRFKMLETYEVTELPIDEIIEIFGLD